MMLINDDFNEFLKANSIWIALAFLGIVLIAFLLVLFISLHNNKKNKYSDNKATPIVNKEDFLDALGGKENIISSSIKGSRLSLVLQDYNLINEEKLQSLGVISLVKMSNKLTLVIDANINKYLDMLK